MEKCLNFFEEKFDLCLMIFIFSKTLVIMGNVSQDPVVFSLIDTISSLLLLSLLLIKKWSRQELALLTIISPLLVLNYYFSKDGVLLWSFFVIMLAINVSKEKLLCSFLTAAVIKNVMTFLLSFLGIYQPFTQLKPGTDIIRYNFGFAHSNTLHMFLFVMVGAYLILRKNNIKKMELVLLLVLNMLLFYYSFSRTSTILIVLLIVISYLLTYQPFGIGHHIKKTVKYGTLLAFATPLFVMVLSLTYHLSSNSMVEKLNTLLSGRIEQANWYFVENGISLIGQFIPEIFIKQSLLFVLDNGYMRVLIQHGLLPFTLLIIGLILGAQRLYTENRFYELSIFSVSLILFILENYLGFVFINIFLIYISVIFEKNRNESYSVIELLFKSGKIKELLKQ